MQRIKNIEQVVSQLKPFLKQYLEENNTIFKGVLFTCPNRAEHKNEDQTPSAGFIPGTDNTVYNCFSCGNSGDLFSAYHYLTGLEITGGRWYETVKELADHFKVEYELEPLLPEEQEFNNTQSFLQTLLKNAHNYLIKNNPVEVTNYIKQRNWEEIISHFELGYLPNQQSVRKYINDSFKKWPELSKYLSIDISRPEDFADVIVNRLIYPIKHRYGYLLGFINRAISDKDTRPKYIKYFAKSKYVEQKSILFNINKTYKSVYVVEGASSVFTLYSKGVKNIVATLGTAFTDEMYSNLIKHGVDRVVFCFDGDGAGLKATYSALKLTQNKSDIKVLIKLLPQGKDPDDIIKEFGVEFFKNIPEISGFKFQLDRYKNTKDEEQEELKNSLFEIVVSTKDAILREKMLKLFVQETGVLKTTLVEEIERYEKKQGLVAEVGVGEILKEETSLIEAVEAFEEKALRSGRLKGISTGFPILDEKIDGVQTGLVLVAGKWNVGKSAFLQTLALNLLKDPTNYVLYFSIDDPVIGTTIPRFLANLSFIPINTVSNPLYKIDGNETLGEAEKLILKQKRNEAISLLKSYSGRLGLKDASDGYDTNFVEKIIKVYKVIAGPRKLVIFVDFLNMVNLTRKNIDRTELETQLAGFFKHMAGLYDIPVICTVESTKGVADSVIDESAIKGSSALQFRSDLTLLLSTDFECSSKSVLYFYDDKGEAQPIIKVRISKNKMSGFKKSIYYKFFRECSKYEECPIVEQQEYGRKG